MAKKKKNKSTNNDLQNITQETKTTRTPKSIIKKNIFKKSVRFDN